MTEQAVEWAVASRSLETEESGDAYLVSPLPGVTMLCVVDGLGHGPAAGLAARRAVELLSAGDVETPLTVLQRCHEGLRSTRGVVLAAAWVDGSRGLLTWLVVGNVHAVLVRARRVAGTRPRLLLGVAGVLGRQFPPVREHQEAIEPGDLLVFATDGIRPEFADDLRAGHAPGRLAPAILAGHWTGGDDALVLAARYRGGPE